MRYFLLTIIFSSVLAFEKDVTFTVQPGHTDCFFQSVKPNEVIDVEYQVIDATHGELDISFQLADAVGRVLVADYKKPENSHRHTATVEGDYRFCFDNSFSTFSTKTVFFDLVTTSDDAPEHDYDDDKEMELGNSLESYIMKVRDISESITRVKDHVGAARHMQEAHSAREARDRNLAEEMNARSRSTCARRLREVQSAREAWDRNMAEKMNPSFVMTWSMWQIVLMIGVGITQVIFVRSLFEDKQNRYRKFIPSFSSQ